MGTLFDEITENASEMINGTWTIEREKKGLAIISSEESERYLVVDKVLDLYINNDKIFLSKGKRKTLSDAVDRGDFLFLDSEEEANEIFEMCLDSYERVAPEDELAYREYINSVKHDYGEDWEDYATSRKEYLGKAASNAIDDAQKKISEYVNDKLYEKTTPLNLRSRDQFVIWKYELRTDKEGKPVGGVTKVPYSPKTGKRASSTSPWSWSDFDTACAAVDKFEAHGVGIMFAKGLVGIDVDHCIENGEISETAKDIIKTVNSYTEYSPSGTGIHILCFGKLPEAGSRRGDVEIYNKARFFTLTGNLYEGKFKKIPKAEVTQEGLSTIYDKYVKRPEQVFEKRTVVASTEELMADKEIIDKCLKSKNGASFDKMFNCGICDKHLHDDGSPDRSLHDLELCSMLAYYTGNETQIDRIFRNSALMRPKWDEYRGGQTYGQKTLSLALQSRARYSYNPSYLKEVSLENWWKENSGTSKLSDEDVIGKCLHSPKGKMFKDIFENGALTYYEKKDGTPNRSKHEFMQVLMLSYVTNDAAQIDRICQKSKLMRTEWNNKGESLLTNGQKLIMRVLSTQKKRHTEKPIVRENILED